MKICLRRSCILAVLFLAGIGSATSAKAVLLTGPVVNPANNHTYYLLAESPWQAAEAEAVALGGHLATINDQAEQDWMFSNFGYDGGTNHSLWIGFNDAVTYRYHQQRPGLGDTVHPS